MKQKNTYKVQIYGAKKFTQKKKKKKKKKNLHVPLEADIQKLTQTPFTTLGWARQVKISDMKNDEMQVVFFFFSFFFFFF